MGDREVCPCCRGKGFLPPVKVCANPTCGAPFRFQEGRAVKGQYRVNGPLMYCSRRCARQVANRAFKARRRVSST